MPSDTYLRRIDYLVAEHVMGLPGWMLHDEYRGWACTNPDWGEKFHIARMSSYSKDIGAAWDVVEKMRDAGWSFSLLMHGRGQKVISQFWLSDLTALSNDDAIRHLTGVPFTGHADDPSLAITEAALTALGVEIPEDSHA